MRNYFLFIFSLLFLTSFSQSDNKVERKKRRLELKKNKKIKKQEKEAILSTYIDPKEKWFFGAEIGENKPRNYNLTGSTSFLQAGLSAEYYFARHWSLSSKIKFYKTGVSFHQKGSGGSGWFNLFSTSTHSGNYRGKKIAIPLFIKWEFRMFKNLGASLKLGYTYNIEIQTKYYDYTNNINTSQYKTNYISGISGIGFNYFLDNQSAIYLDIDSYGGTKKGEVSGLFSDGNVYNSNSIISIGYKYSFN